MSLEQLRGSEMRKVMMQKRKGETKELFMEGINKVSPPWQLAETEEVVWRKKSIPIKRLAHTTHRKSCEAIRTVRNGPISCFKFNKVCGKGKRSPWSTRPSSTYIQQLGGTRFQPVQPGDTLLPGYYSWWEVDFDNETRRNLVMDITQTFGNSDSSDPSLPPNDGSVCELLKVARKRQLDLPIYIQGKGYHGPHKFSADMSTIIQGYQKARAAQGEGHEVVFRFAGTLRYKYQVSSVVIVCCDCDHDLTRYKALSEIPRFHMEKILDDNGHIKKSNDISIGFDSDSITAMSSKDYCRSFWHQAVFAFYSPTEDLLLSLVEHEDGEWKKVWHPICAKYGPDCKMSTSP